MRNKFRALNGIQKTFVIMSVLVVMMPVIFYCINLADALTMDKNSYNCTSDSMMMQLCHHPFTASISWAILYTMALGLPVLGIWAISGIVLLISKKIEKRNSSKLIY